MPYVQLYSNMNENNQSARSTKDSAKKLDEYIKNPLGANGGGRLEYKIGRARPSGHSLALYCTQELCSFKRAASDSEQALLKKYNCLY